MKIREALWRTAVPVAVGKREETYGFRNSDVNCELRGEMLHIISGKRKILIPVSEVVYMILEEEA